MLYVTEIVESINGEINAFHQGSPAIFIRFSGCNLANSPCAFCDTPKSLKRIEKNPKSADQIMRELKLNERSRSTTVVLTGGEPLSQDIDELIHLLMLLEKQRRNNIIIETNGTYNPYPIIKKFPEVNIVMDYKTPSTNNTDKMYDINFLGLRNTDIIKFPVANENDMFFASIKRRKLQNHIDSVFALSPILQSRSVTKGTLEDIATIAMKGGRDGFVISVQLHKLINVY